MYYDALTLAAVADELTALLLGGRVQKIVQPSSLSVGLEIFTGRRHQLLLTAEAGSPGIFLMESKQRRGMESPSPLLLLLWKYVRDGRLEAIQQPPLERVLRLTFVGDYGPVDLICEIMGRYSNIIMVGPDNLVMDAIKRVPSSINRYRTILPKSPYVAPPLQDKENPLTLSLVSLRLALSRHVEEPPWRQLVNAVAGISPLLAREIVFRASGKREPAGVEPERVLGAIHELLRLPETHAWTPSLAYDEDEEGRWPVAYAPYELTCYPDHGPVERISAAIQCVMETKRPTDAYKQVRLRLHGLIAEQLGRQRSRLAALQRSLVPVAEIESLGLRAQLILTLSWMIAPRQKELVVSAEQLRELWGEEVQEPLHIALDPSLSPAENAQKLFKEYRKMQAAGGQVPALISSTEVEVAYLQQLDTEVDLAEDRPQLDEVERELIAAGYLPTPAKRSKPLGKSDLLTLRSPEGILILVGRNSQQNDMVTFRRSEPDDIWLHAHGVPGAHVIVKCGGGPCSPETLDMAARLAAHYSAAHGEAHVQVDWTARRYVRHIKDGHPGMVTYTHEESITVHPVLDDLPEEY
jgi:predicted ribosome quality control (RQC) complex YloA/Tae2 family protein